jgi:hypothetical protein
MKAKIKRSLRGRKSGEIMGLRNIFFNDSMAWTMSNSAMKRAAPVEMTVFVCRDEGSIF